MNTECNQVEQKKPVKERIHKISHVMEIIVKIGRIAAIIGVVGISGLVLFLMLCGEMDLLVWMGDVIWHSPIHIPDMDFGNLNNWVSVGCLIGMVVELIFTVLFLKQVEEILQQVDGVGQVDVMITLKSSGEKVTLKDYKTNEN